MRISFRKEFKDSARNILRRCGYAEHYDPYTKKTSFIRRFSHLAYPRFHLYVNEESQNKLVLNLHLDAKKPSYLEVFFFCHAPPIFFNWFSKAKYKNRPT